MNVREELYTLKEVELADSLRGESKYDWEVALQFAKNHLHRMQLLEQKANQKQK